MPDSDETIELKDGRYGAYVTNGKINATIPKGEDIELLKLERAIELILEKQILFSPCLIRRLEFKPL